MVSRVLSVAARALMALPSWLVRRLAGRPVVVDGQSLDPEAQLALRLLAVVGGPRLDQLSVEGARARLTADVARVSGRPLAGVTVTATGVAGGLRARLFAPPGPAEALLVYFHGGGFVTCDLETHDQVCRFLALHSGARVLSVDYRRAPEHRFPAALEDAQEAFAYAVSQLGAARIGVGGDSAGGNLAANLGRRTGPGAPAFQLLLYPWLELSDKHRSYGLFGRGFYLEETELDWYRRHYLADPGQALDPRCSPLQAADLAGAAPAYIATAGFDPLRDEGEAYARRLRAAGVPVALRRHSGLFHGFANTVDLGRAGREAMLEAAGALRLGLS